MNYDEADDLASAREALEELTALLSDEDLTDDKLSEASERLLPRLHDAFLVALDAAERDRRVLDTLERTCAVIAIDLGPVNDVTLTMLPRPLRDSLAARTPDGGPDDADG